GSEDEDDQGNDHGRASSDWQITGPLTVALRPVRSEPQRVYFITVETTDDAGNASTAVTTVTVMSKQSIAPGFLTSVKPYALPVGPDYTIIPLISSGDRVPRTGQPSLQYQIVGIPDGLGAHRNADGTLSVYMNHEMGNLSRSEARWGEP